MQNSSRRRVIKFVSFITMRKRDSDSIMLQEPTLRFWEIKEKGKNYKDSSQFNFKKHLSNFYFKLLRSSTLKKIDRRIDTPFKNGKKKKEIILSSKLRLKRLIRKLARSLISRSMKNKNLSFTASQMDPLIL